MNAWDPETVRSRYQKQTLGSLVTVDGKTRLQPSRVAMAFRQLVLKEGEDPSDPKTLEKAREPARHTLSERIPFETLNWTCFTMMLSEVGEAQQLQDLLEYADEKLQPTWENGGLYYPRNDTLTDEHWNLTHVEPLSGNSGIGYARLNIEDGQRKIWQQPWTKQALESRPWIDGVSLADGVDFLRGVWDQDNQALIVTLRSWTGRELKINMVVQNLSQGCWTAFIDGREASTTSLDKPDQLTIEVCVGGSETDIIVERRS